MRMKITIENVKDVYGNMLKKDYRTDFAVMDNIFDERVKAKFENGSIYIVFGEGVSDSAYDINNYRIATDKGIVFMKGEIEFVDTNAIRIVLTSDSISDVKSGNKTLYLSKNITDSLNNSWRVEKRC